MWKEIKNTSLIIVVLLVVGYLDAWIYLAIFIMLLVGTKIYMSRNYIKQGFETIECMLWGRPLHKDYWTKEAWKKRPKFTLLPKEVSTTIDMKFRFAWYMFLYSFCMYGIAYVFDYPLTGMFGSLTLLLGIFSLLFILVQLSTALVIYYENKKRRIRTEKGRRSSTGKSTPRQIKESEETTNNSKNSEDI